MTSTHALTQLVPKLEMGPGDSAYINTCPLSEGKSLFTKQQKINLSVTVYMGGGGYFGTASFELLSDKVDLFTVYRREMERVSGAMCNTFCCCCCCCC